MLEVPRERFVPPAAARWPISILMCRLAPRRRLLKPMVLAKLIQAAEIGPTDRVLDVGCATGYAAAVLARIAGQVVALEQDAGLAKAAKRRAVGVAECQRRRAVRLLEGWPQSAPYDVIVLEGATEVVPQALLPAAQGRRPAGMRAGRWSRVPRPCSIAAAAPKWAAGRSSMPRRRCCRVSRKRRFSHSDTAPGSKRGAKSPVSRLFGGLRPSGGFNPPLGRIWFPVLVLA